ncbi:MAG TPA: hypothetical protein VEY90_06195 [Thermoleophilaceae bacterium]|jgi:hypothetical protein|nr:hypothetical protein [Thermoleophilaceae bacterium]
MKEEETGPEFLGAEDDIDEAAHDEPDQERRDRWQGRLDAAVTANEEDEETGPTYLGEKGDATDTADGGVGPEPPTSRP